MLAIIKAKKWSNANVPDCLKMPIIYFIQCYCKNSDINTLLEHSKYQILRCFAKFDLMAVQAF